MSIQKRSKLFYWLWCFSADPERNETNQTQINNAQVEQVAETIDNVVDAKELCNGPQEPIEFIIYSAGSSAIWKHPRRLRHGRRVSTTHSQQTFTWATWNSFENLEIRVFGIKRSQNANDYIYISADNEGQIELVDGSIPSSSDSSDDSRYFRYFTSSKTRRRVLQHVKSEMFVKIGDNEKLVLTPEEESAMDWRFR